MLIEVGDLREGEDILRTEVEITQLRKLEESPRMITLETDREGFIRLGSHIEDVEVEAPECCVEIGPSSEVVLVAPVSVQCDLLSIDSTRLIIEPSQGNAIGAVFLRGKRVQRARTNFGSSFAW